MKDKLSKALFIFVLYLCMGVGLGGISCFAYDMLSPYFTAYEIGQVVHFEIGGKGQIVDIDGDKYIVRTRDGSRFHSYSFEKWEIRP